MSGHFIPLSKREAGVTELPPHEGVPTHLAFPLRKWVFRRLHESDYGNDILLDDLALDLQIDLGLDEFVRYGKLEAKLLKDDELFLDVVDYLLHRLDVAEDRSDIAAKLELERILHKGASVWRTVREGKTAALERRIDGTVRALMEQTVSSAGRAGRLLADAWRETYGRKPNPGSAYRNAVRAIEAAAGPVILPKDPDATLGKMIPVLRDRPDKWEVSLSPKSGEPVVDVRAMMQLVWTSQLDRHGTADESVPLHVSQDEAESALHIAASLVHLFSSGKVTLRG